MLRRLLRILLVLFLAACSAPRGAGDPLRTARQHIEASRCEGVDRYAQAIADLQSALKAEPDRLEVYYWLYVAFSAQGNTAEAERALAALEEAVAAGRGGSEGTFWLFQAYTHKGDAAGADRILGMMESAARSLPSDTGAQFWLGRAYAEQGRMDEALQFFQKTIALNPRHSQAHFWIGQVYVGEGRWEEARAELDAALKEDPRSAVALHNRAVVAYQLGDLQAAASDLQAALQEDPEDPRSHYQLGAVYLAQALPQNPFSPPDSGLLEKARAEFDAALKACPGMPEALIGMGNLLLVQGDPQAALAPLQQAVERHPDSVEAWFALAQAYAILNQTTEACDALERFLALSPPAEWAEQAGKIKGQLGCPERSGQ